jgi:hypothetical protein
MRVTVGAQGGQWRAQGLCLYLTVGVGMSVGVNGYAFMGVGQGLCQTVLLEVSIRAFSCSSHTNKKWPPMRTEIACGTQIFC